MTLSGNGVSDERRVRDLLYPASARTVQAAPINAPALADDWWFHVQQMRQESRPDRTHKEAPAPCHRPGATHTRGDLA
jgi:hypothetical protein